MCFFYLFTISDKFQRVLHLGFGLKLLVNAVFGGKFFPGKAVVQAAHLSYSWKLLIQPPLWPGECQETGAKEALVSPPT